jgi:hypothetical protein
MGYSGGSAWPPQRAAGDLLSEEFSESQITGEHAHRHPIDPIVGAILGGRFDRDTVFGGGSDGSEATHRSPSTSSAAKTRSAVAVGWTAAERCSDLVGTRPGHSADGDSRQIRGPKTLG